MQLFRPSFGVGVLLFLFVSFFNFSEHQAFTQLDKDRFDNAVEVIDSMTTLLEMVTFVSWVSTVSSVVVPFLTGVSIVLDIAMAFVDIPSPELQYLQSGFANLNRRLDTFSLEFDEVKKKIDWSVMQMSYEKYETIVRMFARLQTEVSSAKTTEEMELRQSEFLWRFEHNYEMAMEVLFNAMINETSISGNVFEAAGRFTDGNPELTFRFMQGCTQLLLQAMQVKATYIHLKYNSTAADGYFKVLASTHMKSVADHSKFIYTKLQQQYKQQLPIDVKAMATAHHGMSHREFSRALFQHLDHKYVHRYWFVLSFDENLTDEKDVSLSVCGGGVYTKVSGRNIVVASQEKNFADHGSGWSDAWAKRILYGIEKFKEYHNCARALLNRALEHSQTCKPAAAITVFDSSVVDQSFAHANRKVVVVKKVFQCYTLMCIIRKTRTFTVIMFG